MDVEIGDGDGGVVGDFAFESETGLLDARGDEVRGECGNVVGDAFGKSGGQVAGSGGGEGTAYQRVGIHGKELMVVVVGVVEEELSVTDAVFGGDGGVVNLRNADVEESIAGTDHERAALADGIRDSGARAKVVRIEGNFAGGRE